MMQTFTQDDLIRYLYRETSPEESRQLSMQLAIDNELQHDYSELRKLHQMLDDAELKCPDHLTGNIMARIRANR